MPCFSPLEAYKPLEGGKLKFSEGPNTAPITIPCGQCIGCRLERSRQWAMRCVHEASMHDDNEFITLTYDDDHVPVDHSLKYSHFQDFIRALRKSVRRMRQRLTDGSTDKELRQSGQSGPDAVERCPARSAKGIRFYMCGEYGEDTKRPHYHACLFGIRFLDREHFKTTKAGEKLYRSEFLQSFWPHGYAATGDVTFESAAYIARYVLKKRFGDVANEFSHYKFVDDYGEVHYRAPEFNRMSLKPGIGGAWFDEFRREVYPADSVVMRGRLMKPPKYYDKLLEQRDADMRDYVDSLRYQASLDNPDGSMARLRVREICTRARLSLVSRGL